MGITRNGTGQFSLILDMLYKIVYYIEWAKKSKWALPSGALEQIGPNGRK